MARAILLLVAILAGLAWSRPPGPFSLELKLNGVRQRYALADGGSSGLYGAGPTCMPVTEGDVLTLRCDADVFLCDASTDGGCGATATDINHGVRLGAGTLRTFVPDTNTSTLLCMSSADGGAANCPVWRHR